jgi:hypothetical protein
MKTTEMKNMIDLLREKRSYAFENMIHYKDRRTDIDPKHYHEYKTLFANLIFEIAKQKPMYSVIYAEVTKAEMPYKSNLNKFEGIIDAIEDEIKIGTITDYTDDKKNINIESIIENIFNNFHSCCRQARNRYNNRPTIDVKDEYDVQDLLHILLKLHFSDIRPEEYTPSYAGQSARMDFLIKEYNIVIETKKTRDTLRDKEIGNQLIEDIERYKNHQNCHSLYCFIYDPEGLIGNPKGLENDLSNIKPESV